eukprot:1824126-Rhodomonas_salina.1
MSGRMGSVPPILTSRMVCRSVLWGVSAGSTLLCTTALQRASTEMSRECTGQREHGCSSGTLYLKEDNTVV